MTFFILLLLLSNTYALLNHKWYVIGHKNDFPMNQPRKVTVNNIPISVWRNKQNQFAGVSDVCPHRGVSLAKRSRRPSYKLYCLSLSYLQIQPKGTTRSNPWTTQNSLRRFIQFENRRPLLQNIMRK